ncbi:2Fe-2S iron-sulfur cluster-binding protein [Nocardia sp. CDC159]|uniref:2Fe-2S iron-sulfur cluster-binding protein n=1 Tax=Nocardia pulmonis TaxID=2951408 RepID=A0A9X2IX53_9NOCA|nr:MULTISPECIES: 2Fe-2S iron-sulfur cluster-binding protein [Nocardia]MCM6772556.1 2Fe-2S iron-sulfur cluster-binding protein [Nocardia pulmonis]MCM6784786.1 2Fe-2S iron-sulfur cluster-binding protein [Nocardia sp. CDC159]
MLPTDPTVTVRPKGIRFAAAAGSTVMAAAAAAGYRWPTVCGGVGDCRVCYVEVLEHPERLSEPDAHERAAIAELTGTLGSRGQHVRLACQAVVHGDVVVLKRGVRPESGGHRP